MVDVVVVDAGTAVVGNASAYACDDASTTITVSLKTYGGTGLGTYPPPPSTAADDLRTKMDDFKAGRPPTSGGSPGRRRLRTPVPRPLASARGSRSVGL